jgi:hypothetical protein
MTRCGQGDYGCRADCGAARELTPVRFVLDFSALQELPLNESGSLRFQWNVCNSQGICYWPQNYGNGFRGAGLAVQVEATGAAAVPAAAAPAPEGAGGGGRRLGGTAHATATAAPAPAAPAVAPAAPATPATPTSSSGKADALSSKVVLATVANHSETLLLFDSDWEVTQSEGQGRG